MTKKLLIGAGILAGAGLAYYLWKKNQPVTEEKSKATGRVGTGKSVSVPTSERALPSKVLVCGRCDCPVGYKRESSSSNVCIPSGFGFNG